VEVLIELQIDTYLKINLARTTIKQTKNKALIKKYQDIDEFKDISTSPINFIKNISNKSK
jgi:hypothetical protein